MLVLNVVLIKKSLARLNVVKLVKRHSGLGPGFAFNGFQKLLENQNIHNFEISRIDRDRPFAGKVTLTKQSKSRQPQRKAVDQHDEAVESTGEVRKQQGMAEKEKRIQHQCYDHQEHMNTAKAIEKAFINE